MNLLLWLAGTVPYCCLSTFILSDRANVLIVWSNLKTSFVHSLLWNVTWHLFFGWIFPVAVLEASKDVTRSRHLRKLLEIVLAFGNYMNRGQRGNALGFRINSLNKIIDTKSSINKKITLLHYLAEVVEQKVCIFKVFWQIYGSLAVSRLTSGTLGR